MPPIIDYLAAARNLSIKVILTKGRSMTTTIEILGKYDVFPYTMFCLLRGKAIKFKARIKSDTPGSYDVVVTDGMVKPLQSTLFTGPNGGSLRPNTYEEYYLICSRAAKSYVCEIPKGTRVPEKCVLVHEFGDHFSLQPRVEMPVEVFDSIVTQFLLPCKVYKRDDWLKEYPLGSQVSLPLSKGPVGVPK